jgi:hypothetical protein
MAKENKLIYPLNQPSHWFTWLMITLGILGVTIFFAKLSGISFSGKAYALVFFAWYFSVATIDFVMHKVKLQ